MKWYRPVNASNAKQSQFLGLGLTRRCAPRNDIYSYFSFCYTLLVINIIRNHNVKTGDKLSDENTNI